MRRGIGAKEKLAGRVDNSLDKRDAVSRRLRDGLAEVEGVAGPGVYCDPEMVPTIDKWRA